MLLLLEAYHVSSIIYEVCISFHSFSICKIFAAFWHKMFTVYTHVIYIQVYNAGPSTLPGSSIKILFPNHLSASGAEMFHIQDIVVSKVFYINLFFFVL